MNLEFNKVLIDAARGNVEMYSAKDANEVIRKEFAKVLGIAEDEKNSAVVRRAIRKHKADFYTLIEVAIEEIMATGWGENPFFREFVEERNLNNGDRNIFYTPDNSILTVSRVAGDHHDLVRQKLGMGKSFTAEISTYAIKVYDEYIRFQTGQVDWVKVIEKLYEAADYKVNSVLYDSFMGLKNLVNPELKVAGSVDAEKILDTVEKVQSLTGKDVVLVGSRAAISKMNNLTNAGWVSEKMKDERNSTGIVGSFEGVQTMVIPQYYQKQADGKLKALYESDVVLVLPKTDDKPIKLVWEGDSEFVENTDSNRLVDATVEAEYQWKMGVATIVGTEFGLIDFVA